MNKEYKYFFILIKSKFIILYIFNYFLIWILINVKKLLIFQNIIIEFLNLFYISKMK